MQFMLLRCHRIPPENTLQLPTNFTQILICQSINEFPAMIKYGNRMLSSLHPMSDREATRWQHNRMYPQPTSLCECIIVIFDCVKIKCVIKAHIVSYALLNNFGQG